MLLEGYLRRYYDSAPCAEQTLFEQLLQMQDPELYRYLTAREDPRDPALLALIEKIRNSLHAPR